MKIVILFLAVICGSLGQQEKTRLNGVYRTEFDKNYGLQTFQLTFSDSIYSKRMADAVTSKGKIIYEKYKVTLRKNSDEDPIVIDPRDIGKDTIKFTIKSKVDLSRNLNYGKMIRVK